MGSSFCPSSPHFSNLSKTFHRIADLLNGIFRLFFPFLNWAWGWRGFLLIIHIFTPNSYKLPPFKMPRFLSLLDIMFYHKNIMFLYFLTATNRFNLRFQKKFSFIRKVDNFVLNSRFKRTNLPH